MRHLLVGQYPTMSPELYAPKHIYLHLHFIGLPVEPVSEADFASLSETVSDVLFP